MQNFIQNVKMYTHTCIHTEAKEKGQISKIPFGEVGGHQFAQIFHHIYKNNSFLFGLDF